MSALVVCWPLHAESQYKNVSGDVLDKAQALRLRTLYEVSNGVWYPEFLNDTPGELEVPGIAKDSLSLAPNREVAEMVNGEVLGERLLKEDAMGRNQGFGDRFDIIVVVHAVEGIWPKIAHGAVERSPSPCHWSPAGV